jgi:outer membrane protein assembly factor BamB
MTFAVIPTVFVAGPLALLAILFPGLCGGWLLLLRRWFILLSVLGLGSALYLAHDCFSAYCFDSWWESELALWIGVLLVTFTGTVWAWRVPPPANEGDARPRRPWRTWVPLTGTVAGAVGAFLYSFLHPDWLLRALASPLVVLAVGVLAGLVHGFLLGLVWKRSRTRPCVATEAIVLAAMAGVSLFFTTSFALRWSAAPGPRPGWTFIAPDEGWIASSPLVVSHRVFAAAGLRNAWSPSGALYCLDRDTGERIWVFDNGGRMKPVLSSPCFSAGRIYIGEGFHQDFPCNLYCVDAANGKELWHFRTRSHTESTPCTANGRVYLGAGDDGLYCLDAVTGEPIWHFEGPHVDSSPLVVNDRVYAGSGYGTYEVFCLDADTGRPVWRVPVDMPAFGSAAVAGDQVYFGIGNGDLIYSAAKPSGALLCLDARTGESIWRYDVADAVHAKPLVNAGDVIFPSRDHYCYCLNRASGRLRWKRDLGSPGVAAPSSWAASPGAAGAEVYVLGSSGSVWCLDPRSGLPYWTYAVSESVFEDRPFISSPAVITERPGEAGRVRLYLGGSVGSLFRRPALFCLEGRG